MIKSKKTKAHIPISFFPITHESYGDTYCVSSTQNPRGGANILPWCLQAANNVLNPYIGISLISFFESSSQLTSLSKKMKIYSSNGGSDHMDGIFVNFQLFLCSKSNDYNVIVYAGMNRAKVRVVWTHKSFSTFTS